MLESEETLHENFAQARARIHQWARRIEEDYRATNKNFEELEELRSEIMKEFSTSGNPEGERFSHEERMMFDRKLEQMQEKMGSILKEKLATQQQNNMMKEQMRKLKEALDVLDKRTWALAAANRVLNIFKEVRAAVGEVRVITKDFENLLPDLSKEQGESHTEENCQSN